MSARNDVRRLRIKAAAVSGTPGLLFRRNSRTGAVEALAQKIAWGGLNTALHANA